ncbi:MAG: hypothetical protein WA655_22255 [Candidatus Korobacteraceae bacterium]
MASILLLASVSLSAQEWTWNSEKVARGTTSSIVLDGDHNLHLAYLTRDAKVYYGLRPAGSAKWFTLALVESTHANTNVYPKLAVDKHDIPHLCVSYGVLEYVTLGSHGWVKQQVDPGSGVISYHCSIAVSADGVPHLGWYHEFLPGGTQYSHFRHADLENGVWIVHSVDGGIAGKWSSMAIDGKGFPHASYSQFAHGGDLNYGEWDGNNWILTAVDSSQNASTYRGFDNSLVLWPDGSAHISYFDARTLKYARQEKGKWVIDKVAVVASGHDVYGGSTTLLRDSHGNPHIFYGDFGALRHAFYDGKQWHIETVVSGALQQYDNVDAAIGPDDTLYVSYPDPDDGFVKIATGKLVSGGAAKN